ncbi:hypothetical protein Amsp01_014330 [Amycolatopsis sp. NBRC 101858]|uniref:hypothetical protein n=1 Tax=Amycolatopsis sp. NBRC 101858 TaxID=3032200 RepID=UPI0024A4A7BD|nr:hypothetical protein [Amycolatopsis sp. NBRC 101858]GLY35409.1 hypothetical protein Amsp01_014330 [Amycolatopsis sp. NBRC 101858]
MEAEEPWRPRWWLFWNLGAIAVVHLVASGGWTTTTTVALPIALAVTVVFVFVRRLPWWLTGDLPARRRGLVVAGVAGLLLVDAVVVAALVAHPPHGADVVNAAAFAAIFLGGSVFGLSRLLPKRPLTRRAQLRLRLWFATAAAWAAGAFVLALEIAAVVLVGGWLPWFVPVAGGVAVLALAAWRADLAGPARCLASDSWTPVAAASSDVRPGEPVDGWAVLPGDLRIRFHLPVAPPEIAAELADRRRLWLAGWPSEYLVAGVPDGDGYAIGVIGHRRGGGKNTVPGRPRRR